MIEHVKQLRKVVVVWLSILTALLLVGGVVEDYRSCQRQEPVRALSAQRAAQLKAAWTADARRAERKGDAADLEFARSRRQLAASVRAAPQIDCSSVPAGR